MLNSICWFLPFILVVIVGTDAIVRTINVGSDSLQVDFDFAVDGDVFSFVWSPDVQTPVRVYEVYDNQSCTVMSKGIDSKFHAYPNTYQYTTPSEPIRLTEYPSPPIIYDFYLTAQGAQGCDQGPDSRLEIDVYKPGETPTDIPFSDPTNSTSDIISTSSADSYPTPTNSTAVTSNATSQPTSANNPSNEASSHPLSIPLMSIVTVVGVYLSFI